VTRRVAIIGAGWAGLAAAVEAVEAGHAVTVYEAARTLGGRARTLEVPLPQGGTATLDNGQHILIGAYVETFRLMEHVGVATESAMLRLPLVLRDPQGRGLALPSWPAPWDAAAGILGARGWNWRDKLSLLRAAAAWQLAGFRCDGALSVAELTRSLTPRVRAQLIEPLCVSALNTPAERSSATVFLRVLRDALFGRGHGTWGGSNLLLPRQELGRLFPDAAEAWLRGRGAQLRIGQRAQALCPDADGWRIDAERHDAVVLATPVSWKRCGLLQDGGIAAGTLAGDAQALTHEAIATIYVTGGPRLPLPMLALASGPGTPAQFVFDRSQLGGPAGLLAFVVSASTADKAVLEQEVVAQAKAEGWQGAAAAHDRGKARDLRLRAGPAAAIDGDRTGTLGLRRLCRWALPRDAGRAPCAPAWRWRARWRPSRRSRSARPGA
jgi:squalene-associated FAD-dependent desaturase